MSQQRVLPTERGERALTLIELTVVMAIFAALTACGYLAAGSARMAARVTLAASNLRQTGVGMELYFSKNSAYPAYRSDLARALQPFLPDLRVLSNPLADETAPGQTASGLYRPPTSQDADRPNRYLTALSSRDGTAAAILATGDSVETRYGLQMPAPSASLLDPHNDAIVCALTGQCQTRALIVLNPNPQSGFELVIRTPSGRTITDSDLVTGQLPSYSGPAEYVRFTPNGTSTSDRLTSDGNPCPVDASGPYMLQLAPGGTLNVMVSSVVDPITRAQQWRLQVLDGNAVQLVR